ncbi:MAG: MlaD family protein [Proteobacteria bacterium]|nr:MlaD family protein [Pseudomonadota bacterium]
MASKKPVFTVGIFIIVGIIVGVSTVVWVGASKYFQKGTIYVTYFDESVQGLQIDSKVKYQGVDIGWVTKIGVAPDNKLVEVIMKINFKGDLEHNSVAKLEMAGITGMVFVGLERLKAAQVKLTPRIDFKPDYPVIPSMPSEIQQIFTGIHAVVEKAKQIDFKGISDQIKATSKAIENLTGDNKIKSIMSSMTNVATNLENTSRTIDNLVDKGGKIDDILVEARGAISDARKVISRVDGEIEAMKISETTGKANQLINNITRRTQVISNEIQSTSENLRRASETLDNLLDRLHADPSDIIFSNPPAGK